MSNFDVIIIGAGSVGVPTALALSKKKLKVLVIDSKSSCGQDNNKKAIGGIRATHSDFGKIKVSQRSIEIFSTWKGKHGDDIGWIANGYSFPAYYSEDEKKLKDLMKIQHSFGLNIKWISSEEYEELVPGINTEGLRGSTYSPDDGSASPLLAINAFYFKSLEYGAEYKFNENVINIELEDNKITKVITNKGQYSAKTIINASGNNAKEIGKMMGFDLPVTPDSHEGAITEPVERFFGPMIVDMRPTKGSANYYFYQNNEGQVIFCITPSPPIIGTDSDSTSEFLPQVAKRMVGLYPRLANLKVRRTWRGQYPMTPDGFPIVGRSKEISNLINAVGMCGQGYMLGPGLGELITRIATNELTYDDERVLKSFDPYRDFTGMEQFK
ncbi:MAG: FAD-binding oxidoreductase [Candidatus Cloacimonetes bacterium]|jgi:sarcosine oxidase subunit beta|nr:FAD-binding oxidoreductase [Candidatus Cloacimonadota bacterium]